MQITGKLILNVGHNGLATMKMFHSRLPKTALLDCQTHLDWCLNNLKK